jgi:hypothetical protein
VISTFGKIGLPNLKIDSIESAHLEAGSCHRYASIRGCSASGFGLLRQPPLTQRGHQPTKNDGFNSRVYHHDLDKEA